MTMSRIRRLLTRKPVKSRVIIPESECCARSGAVSHSGSCRWCPRHDGSQAAKAAKAAKAVQDVDKTYYTDAQDAPDALDYEDYSTDVRPLVLAKRR